jgi:hypothetical protein
MKEMRLRRPRVPEVGQTLGLASFAAVLMLAVAGGVLVWAAAMAGTYTLTHSGAPCPNPPSRNSDPAQLVVVTIGLACFLLGHATARWQKVDTEAVRRGIAGSGRPAQDRRKRQALIVQALLLLFLLEVAALLTIEITTLSKGVWPITYYVRCAYDAAGWPSTAVAATILFLVGRWFWLPGRTSDAPPSKRGASPARGEADA